LPIDSPEIMESIPTVKRLNRFIHKYIPPYCTHFSFYPNRLERANRGMPFDFRIVMRYNKKELVLLLNLGG
jgi:hypothetical protein